MIKHPIEPVYNESSKILILGSFPSVKSREVGFFYGHPQNRFWRVLSELFGEKLPMTVEEKKELLLKRKIAVWDVIASCEIEGSADSTIKSVTPNDLTVIFAAADIKAIFVNGKTAEKYYNKYILKIIKRPAILLPSTSAANAAFSLEKLTREWSVIKEYIGTAQMQEGI